MRDLDERAKIEARQFNLRARQLFWRQILPDQHLLWTASEDEQLEWIYAFQAERGLLCDARFGPNNLIVLLSENRGSGLGPLIVDGRECPELPLRVARMFKIDADQEPSEPCPRLCTLLSQVELERACRDRLNGSSPWRAHFSIDSARGREGQSLIIQWSDPLRRRPKLHPNVARDFPEDCPCLAIEIEGVLLPYQLDSDERRWLRRRKLDKATIVKQEINQALFHDEQVAALESLIFALESKLGLPKRFPNREAGYVTDLLDKDELAKFQGYCAKFHYQPQIPEPGVALVSILDRLFGKLERRPQAKPDDDKTQVSPTELYLQKSQEAAAKFQENKQSNSSYLPQYEADSRFNLSQALALAQQGGRSGRLARLARSVQQREAAESAAHESQLEMKEKP